MSGVIRLPIYDGYRPTLTPVEEVEPIDRDSFPKVGNGRACDRCKLGQRANLRTPCIPDKGEPGGLLIVGEAPGNREDDEGEPFAGPSRYLLHQALKRWKGPVAFSNALRCAPGRTKLTEKMVSQCRPFLSQTVEEVAPKRIIALGPWASVALFGRAVPPMSTRRGYSFLQNPVGKPIPVFFVVHPLAALRNSWVRRWFESDMQYALTRPYPPEGPWLAEATVVRSVRLAEYADRVLRKQDWISFDVETTGTMFDPDFEIVRCSVVGSDPSDDDVWVWDRESFADPEVRDVLLRLLQDRKVAKIGANAKYDQLSFRAKYGINVGPIEIDVRLQRKLLDPEGPAKLDKIVEMVGMGGMKEEAGAYIKDWKKKIASAKNKKTKGQKDPAKIDAAFKALGLPSHVEAAVRKGVEIEKFVYGLMPDDIVTRYNARDVLGTKRAAHHMQLELAGEPRAERIWNIQVKPAANAIERVEGWGVGASRQAMRIYDKFLERREGPLKKVLDDAAPDVDWGSAQQVSDLLFKKLRLPVVRMTPTGKPSTDKETLELLAKQTGHPVPKAFLDYRYVTTLRSHNLIEYVRADGRIHPSILLDGARSGRTSCIRRGTPIEIVRDVGARPLGVPVEDVRVGDLAYCYDDDGNLRIRPVVKTWARGKRKLVRVHWRSHGGRTGHLDLTPDHRLGKTDGTWCEAGKLVPGDRLFAMGRRIRDGYAYVQPTASPELREHRFIFEEVFGWSPEAVHHKNERKIDNRVSNLEGMTKALEEATAILRAHAWSVKHAAKASGRDFQCFKDHLVRLGFDIDELKRMNRAGRKEQIAEGAARARAARKVNNHVVTRVEVLDEEDDVFDLMIEEHHNFIAGELRSKNCTDPNLQNIPRAQKIEGKMARDCFVAPPNYWLVEADFSQLELRVAAMLSGDKVMLDIFKSGVDYHLRTAQMVSKYVWGIRPEDVQDEHRSFAKTVNFGVLYGKGAHSLAKEWGVSKDKAQGIVDAILGNFEDLQAWIRARHREVAKRGEVWTWWEGDFARRRPLFRIASADGAEASRAKNGSVNSPVQGTASDFCIASLWQAVDWIVGDGIEDVVKLILAVHDSLMFEVRTDLVDEVVSTVNDIMLSHDSRGVPIAVDFKVGKSWGSMVKYGPGKTFDPSALGIAA